MLGAIPPRALPITLGAVGKNSPPIVQTHSNQNVLISSGASRETEGAGVPREEFSRRAWERVGASRKPIGRGKPPVVALVLAPGGEPQGRHFTFAKERTKVRTTRLLGGLKSALRDF